MEGEDVEFDFRNLSNCTADVVNNNLGSITMAVGYTGTVTFATTFPGQAFPGCVISGDVVLQGGMWTHKPNPPGNVETNRLSVQIGGNLTLGSSATINADGKGFAAGSYGPGKGGTENYAGWGNTNWVPYDGGQIVWKTVNGTLILIR